MTNIIRTLTLTAAVAALLAGGTVALAQGPGGPGRQGPRGPGGVPGVELRGLELTEAQREQVRALAEQYRASGAPVREQLAEARQAQRDALAVVPVNDGLIRATTQALAEAEAEAAIVQARLRADVMALLTPEQIETIETRRAARAERVEARRERVQERRQPRQQDSQ